jgi:hypothetical protein
MQKPPEAVRENAAISQVHRRAFLQCIFGFTVTLVAWRREW